MADFLDLPLGQVTVETLAQAHARNPLRNSAAGPEGWKQTISDDTFRLLWRTHREVAKELGYRRDPAYAPVASP